MICTVTLNPALDKTVVIENFLAGQVNRVSSVRVDPGGKGINVSKCLQVLEEKSVAAAILAGKAGRELEQMLCQLGITPLVQWVEGQTRTNLKIIDPVRKANTDINEPGPKVNPEQLEALKIKISEKLNSGDIVILSGSLPAGAPAELYKQWAEHFRAMGILVLLDADGEALAHGLQGVPYLVKPNNDELARLRGMDSLTQEQMLNAGREMLASGIGDVVISLGGDGALFLSEHSIFRADGLKVPVKSTVGAGDSMVAAMAFGISRKLERRDQIALAMAMGAASVTQDGSQAPAREQVEALARQVVIRQI